MKFEKYQSCGNSYVVVNEDVDVEKVCNPSLGLGADGVLRIDDKTFIQYDANGNIVDMDLNALACFIMHQNQNSQSEEKIKYSTQNGVKEARLTTTPRTQVVLTVPAPQFTKIRKKIDSEVCPFMDQRILSTKGEVPIDSIYVYDVETVLWVHTLEAALDETFAEEIAQYPVFPNKTNVHFVKVVNAENIIVRSFSKNGRFVSSLASGMVGVFALAKKRKKIQSSVRIHLEYGTIEIEEKNNEYTMVIPVKKIATGEII